MKRLVPIYLLAGAVAAFWLAGRQQEPLLTMRRENRLDQGDPLENSPPLVAFTTVALGGFRGIIADLLWIRASTLQEEGKYFELVQLSDWITKLEPRFADVWAFHAWNLAYNISVLFNNPEDRWRWVRHGISLLRDEGLRYNPGDAQLYRELGWMFQHKIGAYYDTAHLYYKQQWAHEMMELFNGPRPDYAAMEAAMPGSDEYRKKRTLIDEYKLDPRLMKQVDDLYGPLDWRLPQAHAVYWAWRGRACATGFEAVAADRMIYQCLGDSFREGHLFLDPAHNLFLPSPNLDLLPKILRFFDEAMTEHAGQDTIRVAYANFLRQATLLMYMYNRKNEAEALYRRFRKDFPNEDGAGGLEPFVYREFSEAAQDLSQRDALLLIEGAAYQSHVWESLGDPARATGFADLARLCWRRYMEPLTDEEVRQRTGLPPFDEIDKQAEKRAIDDLKQKAGAQAPAF